MSTPAASLPNRDGSSASPARAFSRRRLAAAAAVLAFALPPLLALWTAAALWLGPPAAWMAVVAAADATLLLVLLRIPAGRIRVAFALGFVLLAGAGALWLTAAGVVGPAFGLMPSESALRLGPVLFEMVSAPWWTLGTAAWFAAALALSVWWNR